MNLQHMHNQLNQLINQHRDPTRYCPLPQYIQRMDDALSRLELYTERLNAWQNAIPAYEIEKQALELKYPTLLNRAPVGPDGKRNYRADMRPKPWDMSEKDWSEICTEYRSVCNKITNAHIRIQQYEKWLAQALNDWHSNYLPEFGEGRGGVSQGTKSA